MCVFATVGLEKNTDKSFLTYLISLKIPRKREEIPNRYFHISVQISKRFRLDVRFHGERSKPWRTKILPLYAKNEEAIIDCLDTAINVMWRTNSLIEIDLIQQ